MDATRSELTDFCLVLTPTLTAAERASNSIQSRFVFLAEETRTQLATQVAELVGGSVERRAGGPITVVIALEPDAIHGEVSDRKDLFPFEMPLARAA